MHRRRAGGAELQAALFVGRRLRVTICRIVGVEQQAAGRVLDLDRRAARERKVVVVQRNRTLQLTHLDRAFFGGYVAGPAVQTCVGDRTVREGKTAAHVDAVDALLTCRSADVDVVEERRRDAAQVDRGITGRGVGVVTDAHAAGIGGIGVGEVHVLQGRSFCRNKLGAARADVLDGAARTVSRAGAGDAEAAVTCGCAGRVEDDSFRRAV